MELQSKTALRVQTPRVKCISSASGHAHVLVCLFTGEIQLYDKDTLKLVRSAQIGNAPVRTGVVIPSQDWILLGTDEGRIVVVDLGNLSVTDTVLAHDDFIRRIVVDEKNKRLLTVSDDNSAKLWTYGRGAITLERRYKGKHFMMDAAFCPSDHDLFVVASLDGKAYLHSVQHEKALRVFRGHRKGINCVAFVTADYFATGSDDHSIIVWDYRRDVEVTRLSSHTNNVNYIAKTRGGFASCSEDNTVRLWNDEFNVIGIRSVAGRAWAFLEKDGKAFVGSDEELVVFLEQSTRSCAVVSENRVFYTEGNTVRGVKIADNQIGTEEEQGEESLINDIGGSKELGALNEAPKSLVVSQGGKLIAALFDGYFTIFSVLGLRKKITLEGGDLRFGKGDSFLFRNGTALRSYSKFEEEESVQIPGLSALLLVNESIIIINTTHTIVLDRTKLFTTADLTSSIIHEFSTSARYAQLLGDHLVLIADSIAFYDLHFEPLAVLNHRCEAHCVQDDLLFYTTADKSCYAFIADSQVHYFPIRRLPNIIGAIGTQIYFATDRITAYRLDAQFLAFQKAAIAHKDFPVPPRLIDKAISFYECLGRHKEALALCKNESQQFPILVKLGDLAAAFRIADSPIKFQKLGQAFLSARNPAMAAKCFHASGDLRSLLLVDSFGDQAYLREIGDTANRRGERNLAFLAYYRNGDYQECANLLRDTPFFKAFSSHYCSQHSINP